ncbi:unnamed protein product [Cyprideis torosa]|uniref:Uncharacterized protein n=1 Tax=Cyprideis torosa TaxID=163714 RepID=A0A7R8W7T1_9CRUS|nr:unnamed protein product [Cyprideis torosa]CAG0887891.1 unnamed protein product [Cyprideis torosa]
MDNMKKVLGGAGTFFQRAVQYTEEKLGTSERTEFDAHFENLATRAEVTRKWTEKLSTDVQSVLIPNPAHRVEDYVAEKVERRRPDRLTNMEWLGLDMIASGNEFGPGTTYGSALLKVGACEQKLGCAERDFINRMQVSLIHGVQHLCVCQKRQTTLKGKHKDWLMLLFFEFKRFDLGGVVTPKFRQRRRRDERSSPGIVGPLATPCQLLLSPHSKSLELLINKVSELESLSRSATHGCQLQQNSASSVPLYSGPTTCWALASGNPGLRRAGRGRREFSPPSALHHPPRGEAAHCEVVSVASRRKTAD